MGGLGGFGGSDDMKAFAASLCGHFELPKRIKSML